MCVAYEWWYPHVPIEPSQGAPFSLAIRKRSAIGPSTWSRSCCRRSSSFDLYRRSCVYVVSLDINWLVVSTHLKHIWVKIRINWITSPSRVENKNIFETTTPLSFRGRTFPPLESPTDGTNGIHDGLPSSESPNFQGLLSRFQDSKNKLKTTKNTVFKNSMFDRNLKMVIFFFKTNRIKTGLFLAKMIQGAATKVQFPHLPVQYEDPIHVPKSKTSSGFTAICRKVGARWVKKWCPYKVGP